MPPLLLHLAFAVLGASAVGQPAPALEVILDSPVPAQMRWAQDVRWGSGNEFFLTAGRSGVYRLALRKPLRDAKVAMPGEGTRGGFFFSSRLARSEQYLVTASPFAALARRSLGARDSAAIDGTGNFAMIIDIDSYGDEVVILGANRDEKGRWAPEGAMAWRGSLSNRLADLHPVHYSTSGPTVPNLNNCGRLEMGAVRFMADGSFVIAAGVEPGVFLYDASGRLKKTWATEGLGFEDRCRLNFEQGLEYARNPNLRNTWANQHTILEEIIPLPSGPGLILRSFEKNKVTWSLLLLSMSGETRRVAIPVTSSSPLAHLRADVRGDSILILIVQYGSLEKPPLEGPRVVQLKMRGLK